MDVSPQTTGTISPFPVQDAYGTGTWLQTDDGFEFEAPRSSYEHFDTTTQVVRPPPLSPYEELSNDVSSEVFPISVKQIAQTYHVKDQIGDEVDPSSPSSLNVPHGQPMPDGMLDPPRSAVYLDLVNETSSYEPTGYIPPVVPSSYQGLSTDIEARCIATTDELFYSSVSASLNAIVSSAVGQEYDYINKYDDVLVDHEPLMAEGEQRGIITPPTRPLSVTPLEIHEPLNIINANAVSRRRCILTCKILLALTAFVITVGTTVVVYTVVLNTTNNKGVGKLLGHKISFCY